MTQDTTPQDTGAQMRMVPVALIQESPSNPRKHFDQVKLGELAESIQASGVHQPILLRPLHGTHDAPDDAPVPVYELVVGARRLRACKIAQVTDVPAMIRKLTDQQALEIQVIENLQREDVTELEEAEGYEMLIGTSGLTVEQVAAKIGKSRSYVYTRLKILDLCQQARMALREGLIDFSRGLLVARIPDEVLQIKALTYCTQPDYNGDLPGYRDFVRHVQFNYMLNLGAARFKTTDATLLPAAGSCQKCPKRTGANPDLFKDVDGPDMCTDPKCYRAKQDAHVTAVKRTALERGQRIIEGNEAKALMPHTWSEIKGYLRLDNKADSPGDKPLRKLIGKAMEQQGIQPTLVINPHDGNDLVAVLSCAEVEQLLKATNNQAAAAKFEEQTKLDAEHVKQQADVDAQRVYEEQWRWDVLVATWDRIKSGPHKAPADSVLRHIASGIASSLNQDRAKKLCQLLDLGKADPQDKLRQHIASTDTPGDMMQLLVAFRDVEYRHWLPGLDANPGLTLMAETFGIDMETVQAQTRAKQRAAAKAQKAQSKAAQTPPARGQGKPRDTAAGQTRKTAPKTAKELSGGAKRLAQIPAEASADFSADLPQTLDKVPA
ncbi:ParB/RepB/Spo0J family partition protein [Verminephrobacter aporrectodeae]|nr:ParB/RepB/Spo0J family partition protein [Verminephrobacter aporrectodeae]